MSDCAELILSESVWYNTFIKIDANTVYFEEFSLVGINKVRNVFLIRRISTIESYTRSFQYKILNNALFLNKKLFKFGVIELPACSFCGQVDESPIHFFGRTVEETTEMADSIFCFTRSYFGECHFRLYANYLGQWNHC